MKPSSKNNRILILGGTSTLALELAKRLLDGKFFYPILTFRSQSGQNRINHTLAEHCGKFGTVHFDLSNPETFNECVRINSSYIVDFAHSDYESLIASSDPDKVAEYFNTNVSNRAIFLREVSRYMLLGRFGRLVYVSSAAAVRPNPGQGFYAAAKTASEILYKSVGCELSSKGVTTVNVRPGYIRAGRGKDYLEKHASVSTDYIVSEKDVADTIIFLLSDSACRINAAEIVMDGGMSSLK